MKNLKKMLSIMLIFAMAATIFVACGKKEEPQAEVSTSSESESVEEEVEVEEENLVAIDILYEQDDDMINNYSLIAVNPDAPFVDENDAPVSDVSLNTVGAKALIDWILGAGMDIIGKYGYEEYGDYLFYLKDDAPKSEADIPVATDDTKTIRLSTTTSVNDSGLLGYLLPFFEDEYGYTVEVVSAGTGKAIANAKAGNADLLLVHSKKQEEAFIEDGFASKLEGYDSERLTFMYNFFVLVGPKSDPIGVADAASAKEAFEKICTNEYSFVSRGDNSGTHTKEISLWPEDLGITAEADSVEPYTSWYTYSNAGMGVCLTMANETESYILSDKATFLTFKANNGKM